MKESRAKKEVGSSTRDGVQTDSFSTIVQTDDSNEYRYGKWHGGSFDKGQFVVTNSGQKMGEVLRLPQLDDGQQFGVLLDKGRLALFSFINPKGELSVECRKLYRVYERSSNSLFDCFFGSTYLFKGSMREMFTASAWCATQLVVRGGSL